MKKLFLGMICLSLLGCISSKPVLVPSPLIITNTASINQIKTGTNYINVVVPVPPVVYDNP